MNYYSSDKQGRSFTVGLARGGLLECVNTLNLHAVISTADDAFAGMSSRAARSAT